MGKIIWLASYPKSGNTWLRAFLHNYLRNAQEPHDINRLLDLTAAENDAGRFGRYDQRPASQFSAEDVRRMRPLVHRDLTRIFPDYVFVKTHNAFVREEGVPLITPEVTAGAIYMVRDPRDIAVSYAHHLDRPLDEIIGLMATPDALTGGTDSRIYERLGTWSSHIQTWTREQHPLLLVLRYEDMQAASSDTFGRVIRFLGGEPPADRLARAIEFSRFDNLQRQERANGFTERPAQAGAFFRVGESRQWRTALTADQIARIERDHGEQMARFDYR